MNVSYRMQKWLTMIDRDGEVYCIPGNQTMSALVRKRLIKFSHHERTSVWSIYYNVSITERAKIYLLASLPDDGPRNLTDDERAINLENDDLPF